MQKKRPSQSLFTGLVLLLLAPGASAIGWSRAQQSAVLGQPLDFTATLRLDPGDFVAPECVNADVTIGDARQQPPGVRVVVDSSNPEALVMRVLTRNNVDEPVVSVTLAIGCPPRMSRRFVLLADPPPVAPTAVAVAQVAPVQAPPTIEGPLVPAVALPVQPAAVPVAPRSEPAPAPRAAVAPPPVPPKRPVRRPAATPPAPQVAATPRLRLDAAEPPPQAAAAAAAAASAVAEALDAVAQAASSARAAASAASAAQTRVAELEQTVSQLKREANDNRDLVAQMRTRLVAAEGGSRWMVPGLLVILALAALAAWLGWRLRALQNERLAAWRRAAAAQEAAPPSPPTSQLPMVTSEIMAPTTVPQQSLANFGRPLPLPTPVPPPEPVPAMERTQVLPPHGVVDDGSPRDVSIEELLDLEQQAEFFIVLGQEDAAVDLLVDHLRNTGGGSPLPYLKLLEIYRRREARDAYERTRTRFNHRFNAYAPDWDADLQQGRTLEDYAGVLPRLQQVWPRPLDAMAELEALLFRKSRGELFELPAYREVLFLYSLARDLLDREAANSGDVDLLLPLADGGEFSSTSPHPYFGLERDSVFDSSLAEDKPTAPIDLDLTQPEAPSAIVEPVKPSGQN